MEVVEGVCEFESLGVQAVLEAGCSGFDDPVPFTSFMEDFGPVC